MTNSIFDTNQLKKNDSLELEHRLLTSVNIQFDYYPITCRDIQKTSNAIHSIYRGNANRPNIILNNNQYFPTYYQTVELAIYSKIHDGTHQSELIIKHIPISGSIIPIYVCFFINSQLEKSTETYPSVVQSINSIIQSTDPLDIDMSPLLTPYVFTENTNKKQLIKWQIYETVNSNGKCMVVLIDKPLYINSELINKIPQTKTPPFKILNTFKTNNSIETFVSIKDSTNNKTGYALEAEKDNEMICDMIPDPQYGDIQVVQMPLQIGKDSSDRLYILNMLVYICASITITTLELWLGSIIFDYLVYFKYKNYDIGKQTTRILLVVWVIIFAIPACILLILGLLSSEINMLFVGIGTLIGFSGIITSIGIWFLSKTTECLRNNSIVPGENVIG